MTGSALTRTAPGAGASRADLRAVLVRAAQDEALAVGVTYRQRLVALDRLRALITSTDPDPSRRTALALTGAPLRAVDLLRVELELIENELTQDPQAATAAGEER